IGAANRWRTGNGSAAGCKFHFIERVANQFHIRSESLKHLDIFTESDYSSQISLYSNLFFEKAQSSLFLGSDSELLTAANIYQNGECERQIRFARKRKDLLRLTIFHYRQFFLLDIGDIFIFLVSY